MKKSLLFIAVLLSLSLNISADNLSLYVKKSSLGTYGCVDASRANDWYVCPVFKKIEPFGSQSEFSMATFDGKNWAVIDKYGGLRTGMAFPGNVIWGDYGIGVCKMGDKDYRLVNLNGETMVSKTVPMQPVGDRIAIKYNEGFYTLVDYNLDPVSIEKYSSLTPKILTVGGRTVKYIKAVMATRGVSILDVRGNTVSHFDEIENAYIDDLIPNDKKEFSNMMLIANRYGKWGLVSLTGRTIVPFDYKSSGKLKSNLKKHAYKEIRSYVNGYAQADFDKLADRLAQADEDVRAAIQSKYPDMPASLGQLPIVRHIAHSIKSGGKYYLTDNDKPRDAGFRSVRQSGEFWIVTKADGLQYLYNSYGLPMSSKGYAYMECHGYDREQLPYFMIKEKGKVGFMDMTGNVTLVPSFDELDYISDRDDVIFGKRAGKYYPLDGNTGKQLGNIAYDMRLGKNKNGKYNVKRAGYDLTLNSKGVEDPSLEQTIFNTALEMDDSDFAKKLAEYKKCIELADADNKYLKGNCYNNIGAMYEGKGDKTNARIWYKKGADVGNAKAKNRLAALDRSAMTSQPTQSSQPATQRRNVPLSNTPGYCDVTFYPVVAYGNQGQIWYPNLGFADKSITIRVNGNTLRVAGSTTPWYNEATFYYQGQNNDGSFRYMAQDQISFLLTLTAVVNVAQDYSVCVFLDYAGSMVSTYKTYYADREKRDQYVAVNKHNYNPSGNASSSSSYSSGSSDTNKPKSGLSLSYYQENYARWESNAKICYEELTQFGYRTKQGDNYKSGGAGGLSGMRPSTYTGMKQNLRAAQREMQRLRQEASRAGYNIPKSMYETVTVNY